MGYFVKESLLSKITNWKCHIKIFISWGKGARNHRPERSNHYTTKERHRSKQSAKEKKKENAHMVSTAHCLGLHQTNLV